MMDDPEFDKLMDEIFPMSIPTEYVESILVTLASGQEIEMSGDELLHPLPLADDLNWEKLVHRFDKIADVQVKINVDKIKDDVATNVKTILDSHFDAEDDIDGDIIDGDIIDGNPPFDSPLPDKLTGYMEPPEDFEDGNNDTSTDND
jgi:hypothetical protein|tara:strand:+ start:620 stop:1060 length:441 start_codon:yes stop_codon:yes gene_type:complete